MSTTANHSARADDVPTTVKLRLPTSLLNRIKAHAQRKGESVSVFIRRACRVTAYREACDRAAGPVWVDEKDAATPVIVKEEV